MELRELRAFVAVVQDGGLSAAARRLHMSQPALSQTISGLERQLGVKLLVRSSTGVRATEAGTALLTEARAVLARHDQALRVMARYVGPGGGALRIGIPLELPGRASRRGAGGTGGGSPRYPGAASAPVHRGSARRPARG
ncbi:LysR family transcriptional regulator [Streptomyces chartreusis]